MRLSARTVAILTVWPAALAAMVFSAGCDGFRRDVSYDTPADAAFQAGIDRPPTAGTLYAMARILARQDKPDQCRFVLLRIIQDWPDFRPAYSDLAELYVRTGQPDDAARAMAAALAKWPGDAVLLNNMGMCLLAQKDYPGALARFAAAAEADTANPRYMSNAALAAGMMGRYDDALALYMRILPEADARYNLGVICEARGDGARAAEEFRRAEGLQKVPKQ